jgi:hypothetical protein
LPRASLRARTRSGCAAFFPPFSGRFLLAAPTGILASEN